jgi:hypothetical protein
MEEQEENISSNTVKMRADGDNVVETSQTPKPKD